MAAPFITDINKQKVSLLHCFSFEGHHQIESNLFIFYALVIFIHIYQLAVLVIALYGLVGLCCMTCEAQPIIADPNGLVNPIMAWLT